jgi:predicted nucleic acid-binding protein
MEYLLDTSAIVAYLTGEKEADRITSYLKDSSLPFIVLSELYYIVWKRKGEVEADRAYGLVKSWNLPILLPNERIILFAGKFKATHRLGMADSYIAAFALDQNLTLVAKDRDYNLLKDEIKILQL